MRSRSLLHRSSAWVPAGADRLTRTGRAGRGLPRLLQVPHPQPVQHLGHGEAAAGDQHRSPRARAAGHRRDRRGRRRRHRGPIVPLRRPGRRLQRPASEAGLQVGRCPGARQRDRQADHLVAGRDQGLPGPGPPALSCIAPKISTRRPRTGLARKSASVACEGLRIVGRVEDPVRVGQHALVPSRQEKIPQGSGRVGRQQPAGPRASSSARASSARATLRRRAGVPGSGRPAEHPVPQGQVPGSPGPSVPARQFVQEVARAAGPHRRGEDLPAQLVVDARRTGARPA